MRDTFLAQQAVVSNDGNSRGYGNFVQYIFYINKMEKPRGCTTGL